MRERLPRLRRGGGELARELVRAYLDARYDRGERHQQRLDKVVALERRYAATARSS